MEMALSLFEDFTGMYPLQKTLRFELKPVGKTGDRIKEKKVKGMPLLEYDADLAQKYQEAKKIMDNYHKQFIEEALTDCRLSDLETCYERYQDLKKKPKDKGLQKAWGASQTRLRKEIVAHFKKSAKWKNLLKGDLLKKDLPVWVDKFYKDEKERSEKRHILKGFKTFSGYFSGFQENRKNMYSDEEQSTAIAYRLVNENLPKFMGNLLAYEAMVKKGAGGEVLEPVRDEIVQRFHCSLEDFFRIELFNDCLRQTGIDAYNAVIGGYVPQEGEKIQGINEKVNLYNQQQKEKSEALPRMTELFKQILSDREGSSLRPEAIKEDKELVEDIRNFCQEDLGLPCFSPEKESRDVFDGLQVLLKEAWVLEQLRKAEDLSTVNLMIRNKDWYEFAQGRFE